MRWRTLLSLRSLTHTFNIPLSRFITHGYSYRHLHFHSPQIGNNSLINSGILTQQNENDAVEDDDETTNEFLSRFAWIMRKKVKEAYPEFDKGMVDGILLVIVQRVASEMEKGNTTSFSPSEEDLGDFSEDLWKTAWLSPFPFKFLSLNASSAFTFSGTKSERNSLLRILHF